MTPKIASFISALKTQPTKPVLCGDVATALETLFQKEAGEIEGCIFNESEVAWIVSFSLGMSTQVQKNLVDHVDKKLSELRAELLPHLAN